MKRHASMLAYEAARLVMPGGVNSPARACRSVGAQPSFITQASGAELTDADGNTYSDYVGAFGPMILGHGHPTVIAAIQRQAATGLSYGAPTVAETDLAHRVIDMVPGIERLRLVSSGTEAMMSAIRLARGATGRHKLIKFEGCYHGHVDPLLVKAGSAAMTLGSPDSAGVTPGAAQDTLLASYNDLESVQRCFAAHPGQIAAVVLEPVCGNMGVVIPEPGFLEGLKALAEGDGALVIFDEVMTGFRVSRGGAQERFGVTPDITALGKIVGGGLPVGAYGASAGLMTKVSPEGAVFQAGTNSGNPLSVAAGLATLQLIQDEPINDRAEAMTTRFREGLQEISARLGIPTCVQQAGSMMTLFFVEGPVLEVNHITTEATLKFAQFWREMRQRGQMLPPSQYEAWFISAAHDEARIDLSLQAAEDAMKALD